MILAILSGSIFNHLEWLHTVFQRHPPFKLQISRIKRHFWPQLLLNGWAIVVWLLLFHNRWPWKLNDPETFTIHEDVAISRKRYAIETKLVTNTNGLFAHSVVAFSMTSSPVPTSKTFYAADCFWPRVFSKPQRWENVIWQFRTVTL